MRLGEKFADLRHELHDHAEDYEHLRKTQQAAELGLATATVKESKAVSHVPTPFVPLFCLHWHSNIWTICSWSMHIFRGSR